MVQTSSLLDTVPIVHPCTNSTLPFVRNRVNRKTGRDQPQHNSGRIWTTLQCPLSHTSRVSDSNAELRVAFLGCQHLHTVQHIFQLPDMRGIHTMNGAIPKQAVLQGK